MIGQVTISVSHLHLRQSKTDTGVYDLMTEVRVINYVVVYYYYLVFILKHDTRSRCCCWSDHYYPDDTGIDQQLSVYLKAA